MNALMNGITIVGLGPGDGRYLTREAWDILSSAETVFVRTADHPAVLALPDHVTVVSFDAVYASSADFESVYIRIVADIVERGARQSVIYAVPGHPFVAEATVQGIVNSAETQGIPVTVIAGLSFIEPVLSALHYDGLDGLQLFDAIDIARFSHPPLNPDFPLLLGQVYSRWMAGDLKLALMRIYPESHSVTLVHDAGTEAQQLENVPLYAIDHSEHIRNLTCLFVPALPAISSLAGFAESIAVLRGPDGCPWDREQTPQSMRAGFIEEVAEAIEALDADDPDALREELGDVLLHVVFQAQLAAESDEFTLTDVIAGIDAKIKRRHPHVWGDAVISDTAELVKTWEAIKAQEKHSTPDSTLANISGILPALARSQKIQNRVKKVGFDWASVDGVWQKVYEEIAELQSADSSDARHAEFGDILFAIVNLGRWLDIEAEIALRDANERFIRRFQIVEQLAGQRGQSLAALQIEQLEALWQEAKLLA
jgi:tetrapyrrole methylase family protein/MazG family protein